MTTDTWITPPEIITNLGEFDLDPCTPDLMPWLTAKKRFTIKDDGMLQDWFGRVWLNPPYGREIERWMHKMGNHGNGIAMVFARTETQWFISSVWQKCHSIMFLESRIHFHNSHGVRAKGHSPAPSVLIAYGSKNSDILEGSGIPGKFLAVNYTPVIIVGVSPSWISVVTIAVKNHGDQDLSVIYEMVERIAPDKVSANKHWREKIRQKVQLIRLKKSA